ncbi:MAG: Fe-S cluster assembly protein SufB [Fimbriimonadales bacterium]|nr:MAG: Fe-S cluster assembly protein SufB [Fimbriimonadales bacterium]
MAQPDILNLDQDYKQKYGFYDEIKPVFQTERGLTRRVVEEISYQKNEPKWMRDFRLEAYEIFMSKPMPSWGPDLSRLDFDEIVYYIKPTERQGRSWDEVPEDIKRTFDRLGIPEWERKFLAGVGAQYDSEVVYHNLAKQWEEQGVIFVDTDTAVREYPDLVKEYFGTVIPPNDNKFAALNSAVWSGGSFVYVPAGVKVDIPLQAYFRINARNAGQFERTLIIAEEGSFVHYVEGCTAPVYAEEALHSAVVEIIVKRGARVRYTTIQNWSKDVYNLVTKRAVAYGDSVMEWVDGNIGSRVTQKYPSVYLMEPGARGEILSVAFAGDGQHQDTGGKLIFAAPNTTGRITSKSISKGTGRASYRGLVQVLEGAHHAKCNVECDALLLDEDAKTDTYPYIEINEKEVTIGHEARVSKVSDEQIFYLQSRGLKKDEALTLIVSGFIEPLAKQLPMEYAVELNRLIELEMEGSVG